MARWILAAVVGLAFASAGFAGDAELVLKGGLSVPSKPDEFKDTWSNGFNLGGGFRYWFNDHVAVVGQFNYDRFSFDEEAFQTRLEEELGFSLSGAGVTFTVD